MLTITGFPRSPTSTPSNWSADRSFSSPAAGIVSGGPDASKLALWPGRLTAKPTRASSPTAVAAFTHQRRRIGAGVWGSAAANTPRFYYTM